MKILKTTLKISHLYLTILIQYIQYFYLIFFFNLSILIFPNYPHFHLLFFFPLPRPTFAPPLLKLFFLETYLDYPEKNDSRSKVNLKTWRVKRTANTTQRKTSSVAMRHIERRLSVALFLGKNSSTLGVCINRVECEFPFSTSFFFPFFSPSPFFFLSFPFLSFSIPQEKRVKRKSARFIYLYTVERLTHVRAYDRRILFMREARRQTEDWKRYGKKFGVIARDDDSMWFPSPPLPPSGRECGRKSMILALSLPPFKSSTTTTIPPFDELVRREIHFLLFLFSKRNFLFPDIIL